MQGALMVKNPPASAGDVDRIPGSRKSPGGALGNPLQHSRLENPADRGAWRPTVLGVAKSRSDTNERLGTHAVHSSSM